MKEEAVGYELARERIARAILPLPLMELEISRASGYVLGEDLYAPLPLPPWTTAAMDGYALALTGLGFPARLRVTGEVRAGEPPSLKVGAGEAVRVFTGSLLPEGAGAVVPFEKVQEEGSEIVIPEAVAPGANIRYQGEELLPGEKAVPSGTRITPGVAGFLSSMGVARVKVHRKPRVTVITTGSETVLPGEPLTPGKVYDVNSLTLAALLRETGVEAFRVHRVPDEKSEIEKLLEASLPQSELILFSGGISRGHYDYVRIVLEEKGVEKIFYRVKQKPGGPLFFGRAGETFIFGLPGNPGAVLTCFYEYVYPALRIMMGFPDPFLPQEERVLVTRIEKDPHRLHFLRGVSTKDEVSVPRNQNSHMLSSFVGCNCLVLAPPGISLLEPGERVQVHLLP